MVALSEVSLSVLSVPAIFLAGYLLSTEFVMATDFQVYKEQQALKSAKQEQRYLSNKLMELDVMNEAIINPNAKNLLVNELNRQIERVDKEIEKYRGY